LFQLFRGGNFIKVFDGNQIMVAELKYFIGFAIKLYICGKQGK